MSARSNRGMTLLEVLIAVTLVSLLSLGLLFAMRAGLEAMGGVQRRIERDRRTVGAERILEMQFGGFLPVIARCGSTPTGPAGAPYPFFQGEPEVLRFVSSYSLLGGARGEPNIVEYFPAPNPAGGFRLLVNEIPYRGPVGAGFLCGPPQAMLDTPPMPAFPPPQPGPRSFILVDQLAGFRFSYLEHLQGRPNDVWVPRWTRIDIWPRAIRLDVAPLPGAEARLPAVPFVARIHVTRLPREGVDYAW